MTLAALTERAASKLHVRVLSQVPRRAVATGITVTARQWFHQCSRWSTQDKKDAPVAEANFWEEYKSNFNFPKPDFPFWNTINPKSIGTRFSAVGFLGSRRDLSSSLSFASLSNGVGPFKVQIISQKGNSEVSDAADKIYRSIKPHSAVCVTGVLCRKQEPKNAGNEAEMLAKTFIPINKVELRLESIQCVSSFPKDITVFPGHLYPAKSRHLQIRFDDELKENLRIRSEVADHVRRLLHDFREIETPILFKSTPEGANEFLVPTRKAGYAYALPQSPQQYKQMLIASGIPRYLQFAKCFRDEDLRTDRQPEFTQLDLEMAWATGQDVMKMVERLIREIYKKKILKRGNVLELPLSDEPFYRMTYTEAMSLYGSDKPDLRNQSIIHRIEHICSADLRGMLTSIDDPIIEVCKMRFNDTPSKIQKFIRGFMESPAAEVFRQNSDGAPGIMVFDPSKPLEGLQASGFEGAAKLRALYSEAATQPFNNYNHEVATKFDEGDLFLIQARDNKTHTGGSTILGRLRTAVHKAAVSAGLVEPDKAHRYLWVTDFPLFTLENSDDPGHGGTAGFSSTHHPFTAPKSVEDVDLLLTDPLKAVADHYDLVVNGIELGGGSRRIHNAEIQRFVMQDVLKMPKSRIADFEHLLDALRAGCPPHAGFAIGFDRLIAVMVGQDSIRDVIPFPKSSKGDDVQVKSPSPMTKEQMERYHLQPISKPRQATESGKKVESGENRMVVEHPSQA